MVDSLYFNSGVFLGNNRELDSNIAALSSSQETFLQNNSLRSQIPFPSILLTSLTIGNVDPSVPFLLITITKPHSMVGLTSCVSANIFCYIDPRCSDGRTADSLTPIWIYNLNGHDAFDMHGKVRLNPVVIIDSGSVLSRGILNCSYLPTTARQTSFQSSSRDF